jgi:hypothetical protein
MYQECHTIYQVQDVLLIALLVNIEGPMQLTVFNA